MSTCRKIASKVSGHFFPDNLLCFSDCTAEDEDIGVGGEHGRIHLRLHHPRPANQSKPYSDLVYSDLFYTLLSKHALELCILRFNLISQIFAASNENKNRIVNEMVNASETNITEIFIRRRRANAEFKGGR